MVESVCFGPYLNVLSTMMFTLIGSLELHQTKSRDSDRQEQGADLLRKEPLVCYGLRRAEEEAIHPNLSTGHATYTELIVNSV